MLEIAVCSLTNLIDYPQNLTNADILGQGNLNLVSEKSGKSQGILLSIICGNPVYVFQLLYWHPLIVAIMVVCLITVILAPTHCCHNGCMSLNLNHIGIHSLMP